MEHKGTSHRGKILVGAFVEYFLVPVGGIYDGFDGNVIWKKRMVSSRKQAMREKCGTEQCQVAMI